MVSIHKSGKNGHPKQIVDLFGNPITSEKPRTAGYRPVSGYTWGLQLRDLPLFSFLTIESMLIDETVNLGLAMRMAPLVGVEFAYKQGQEWVPGVKSDSKEVADFVERQLHKIWKLDIVRLLTSQVWGWAAAEVLYKVSEETGLIEYNGMLGRHASDCRALQHKGELVGVQFGNVDSRYHEGRSQQFGTRLGLGKAVWHAHKQLDGSFYGVSVLKGAYSAWADKWLPGGALDVRRLFMMSDSYGGRTMRYPPGTTEIEGLGDVPNRDIAREIVEMIKSGATPVYPAAYDESGKPLWELTDPTVTSNPVHILQYPKDCNIEILRGMEIPDDYLTSASQSGAWAGKQVPMTAFYSALTLVALDLLRTVVIQILEPLVLWNWGKAIPFEVDIKPLEIQIMEQQGAGQPGGGPQAPGMPQAEEDMPGGFGEFEPGGDGGFDPQSLMPPTGGRDSLMPPNLKMSSVAEQVGAGLYEAATVVNAARSIAGPEEDDSGEYKFCSTHFDIPADMASRIVQWTKSSVPANQLSEEGIERQPHVTVLYGILDDSCQSQVEHVLRNEGPLAVQLGPLGVFSGVGDHATAESQDVLYASVDGNALRHIRCRLNDAIPNRQTHPEYIPHVTLAYLKPGEGAKYVGMMADGISEQVVPFRAITFSDTRGRHTPIPLCGPIMFGTAPAGGITIGERTFKHGEFIPAEVVESATPEEREAVEKSGAFSGASCL